MSYMFQDIYVSRVSTLADESLAKNPTTVGWIESDESLAADQTHAVQRMFGKWGHQEKSSEIF